MNTSDSIVIIPTYNEKENIEKIIRTHSDGTQGTTIQYTWQYSKG